jgi:uncharacterized protein YgiM (DUF1202 family)
MNSNSPCSNVDPLRSLRRIALALLLLAGLIPGVASLRPNSVLAADFSSGDTVVVFTDMLNLRSAASLSAEVKTVVPYGTEFVVNGGPTTKDGYDWYNVIYATGTGSGWVAGDYIALVGENMGFIIGDWVVVNAINLNLRTGPGLDADIEAVVPLGTDFTIVAGATTADGYDWYEVSNASVYGTGWAAGEFLETGGSGGGTFEFGDAVVTTDVLNVRDAPGLGSVIFRTASVGETFEITAAGPILDGYTWYEVSSTSEDMPLSGNQGWVAGAFLEIAG